MASDGGRAAPVGREASASQGAGGTVRTDPPAAHVLAFRILVGASILLVGALLAWGLMHRSAQADLLGRYSFAYAGVLAAMAAALAWLVMAFTRPGSRPAAWLGNAYLVLFSTLVPLALLEAALRLFDPWGVSMFEHLPYHMQGMIDHATLGYVHPTSVQYSLGRNVVRLNSHGLRMDEDIAFEKRRGEQRVLVIGDSTAFGWGVSQGETFSDSLQRRLRSSRGDQWTVINAGVNGYNTSQEVEYFLLTGRRYQPDIVVLMFNSNDVEPRIVPNVTTWRRHPSWPKSLPEFANRIRQMSYTYQLPMLLGRAQMMDIARRSGAAAASVTEDPGWPGVARELARLRDACTGADIRLLVTMQSSADSKLISTIESMGISVSTMQSAWEGIPPERRHVSRIDPHPSSEAHEQFGRILHAELLRRGWLRPR